MNERRAQSAERRSRTGGSALCPLPSALREGVR